MAGPIRVLHLDDDLLDAELIQERLRAGAGEWDFVHVTSRAPFEAALELAGYDLVIMDHNIPGYDGMVALEEAHRKLPDTPIIIISGSLTEEDAVDCLKAGATDYVLKQRMQRLNAAAARALEEAKVRRRQARAEHELRELALRFRELAAQSADVFWFVSADPERITYISPGVERLWGRPVADLTNTAREWANAIHDEDRERVKIAFDAWVRGVAGRFDEEYRVVHRDGSFRWVQDTGTRITDDAGRVVRLSGVARDVTRRHLAEEELRRANAQLEQRAQDRGTALRAATRELEGLAFCVSHDLRAPLRAVTGFLSMLKDDIGDQLDATARGYLERIQSSAERMDRMIEDLVRLSQVSRADMIPGDTDLSALAVRVAGEIQSQDAARRVEVSVAPGLRIQADPRLLRIALEQLIGNAFKFTSDRPDARIEVGLASDNGLLNTYFVRDDGVGFDPRFSERLFAPFQRLHADGKYPGAGIGLAMARRAIERHGGNIWADSRPGEGATFFFTLPRQPLA